jgi:hypothetical protein
MFQYDVISEEELQLIDQLRAAVADVDVPASQTEDCTLIKSVGNL